MSQQITILSETVVHAPVQAIASLIIGQLIESIEGIDAAMSEGKHGEEGQYWPDSEKTTACDYTVRAVRDRLKSMVGRSFDDMGDLLWETYHAMEPLRLVAMLAPKTSKTVTYRLELAIRDYDALSSFMDSISMHKPAAPQIEPEIKRSRKATAKTQEVVA